MKDEILKYAEENVKRTRPYIHQYLERHWKITPLREFTKKPLMNGWNFEDTPNVQITEKNEYTSEWYGNIGLLHAFSGTCCIDLDNLPEARKWFTENGIDIDQYINADDAVHISSGRKNRCKLLYMTPMGLPLPTYNYSQKYGFEFRCGVRSGDYMYTVQDVLPPSIHPDTKQRYVWAGKGSPDAIPDLPRALQELWLEQSKHSVTMNGVSSTLSDFKEELEWITIESAVNSLDPDMGREEWLQVMAGVHHASAVIASRLKKEEYGETLGKRREDIMLRGFNLLNTWSSQSKTKYKGRRDVMAVYNSFLAKACENVITINSVYALARQNGWKQPPVNAEKLFSNIEISTRPPAPSLEEDSKFLPEPSPDNKLLDDMIQVSEELNSFGQPKINLSMYPSVIAQLADEISSRVGCDPAIPMFAAITACSGIVDANIRLQVKNGFKVPPVLWTMIIADPSDKKTPGSEPIIDVIHKLEYERIDEYKLAKHQHTIDEKLYEKCEKDYLRDQHNIVNNLHDNDAKLVLPKKPEKPVQFRLLVKDTNTAKLSDMLADRPAGMMLYRDELGSWLKKLTQPQSDDDRSMWVESFSCAPYQVDRIGRGEVYIPNLALSIFGNVQPDVINHHIDKLSDDGLLSRFIPIAIGKNSTTKGKDIPSAFSTVPQFEQLLRRLLTVNERTYELSDDAYQVYDDYQNWYYDNRSDENVLNTHVNVIKSLGKSEGIIARLALVFHMIDDPFTSHVSAKTMQQAVDVYRHYILPGIRYFYSPRDQNEPLGLWLMRHIISLSGVKDQVTTSELTHSARIQIQAANIPRYNHHAVIDDIMIPMENSHWVEKLEQTDNRTNTWAINPRLKDIYANERTNIIKAKQARLDSNRETAIRATGKYIKRRIHPGYDQKWDSETLKSKLVGYELLENHQRGVKH